MLHSLELTFDAESDALVRADWQALRDAGLPSQLDHRGVTNAPHVTVVAAAALSEEAVDTAVTGLGPMLPLRARASGLVLLGGQRLTVARLLDLDDGVVRQVLAVRAHLPARQHLGWLPHVTLARRLPRDEAQAALGVLGHADVELTLTSLRRWDPDQRSVRVLVPPEMTETPPATRRA